MPLDYEMIMQSVTNNIRARAPYKTGALKSSIKFIASDTSSEMFGKIDIDVPYATFVDYGYLTHPKSSKLKRDYLFVEKGIRNALKVIVNKSGGGYVK